MCCSVSVIVARRPSVAAASRAPDAGARNGKCGGSRQLTRPGSCGSPHAALRSHRRAARRTLQLPSVAIVRFASLGSSLILAANLHTVFPTQVASSRRVDQTACNFIRNLDTRRLRDLRLCLCGNWEDGVGGRAWRDCDGDGERAFGLDALLTDVSVYWFGSQYATLCGVGLAPQGLRSRPPAAVAPLQVSRRSPRRMQGSESSHGGDPPRLPQARPTEACRLVLRSTPADRSTRARTCRTRGGNGCLWAEVPMPWRI